MSLAQSAMQLVRCQHHTALHTSLAALAPVHAAATQAGRSCTCPVLSSSRARSGTAGSRRSVAAAAAAPDSGALTSTRHPLIDWVQRNGGAVNGVGVANLAGSDGGSGWGLVATEVSKHMVLGHHAYWRVKQTQPALDPGQLWHSGSYAANMATIPGSK